MDALNALNLAQPIADTFNALERLLLCHIAEQIAANSDMMINATSEWRLRRLAEAGRLTIETAAMIRSMVGGVPSEVERVIDKAVSNALADTGAQMTAGVSGAVKNALKNYDRQAIMGKYNQVCTVMQYKAKQAYTNAVNGAAQRMMRKQQAALSNSQEYLDALNKHAMAVTLGEQSRTEALRETIGEMCDKGIPAFVDKSGREWSPEAYVNMDIRNTAKNAANAADFAVMDELGQDVVLVSSHSGARPKCAPYQGKFYSRSGKSGTIADANGKLWSYSPLSETSYGQPDGLLGINCGHHFRGVSEGLFYNREVIYDEKENSDEYEAVQKQRAMERSIRKDKTKRDALKAAGDKKGAREIGARIRSKDEALKAYCDKEGLSYRRDRTEVYGYRDKGRKVVPPNFVETVDKSGKSGIIGVGSERERGSMTGTLEKEKQYGVPYGEHSVNADMKYINSDDYAKKFDNITDNAAVNKTLLACSRKAIEHRSGTEFEDMYIINAIDGTIMGEQLDSANTHGVDYNDSIKKALTKANLENIPIVAFHNHPLGVPPSADDFNKAFDNNYSCAVVGGHNGQVYIYSNPGHKIENPDLLHGEIAFDVDVLGIDVDRAYQEHYKENGFIYKIAKGAENNV